MKLFKFENYKVTVEPETILLKPFKAIWDRDKSKNKVDALQELGYVYFFCDPRSDYQYLIDEDERTKAIIEGEGFAKNWKPDRLILNAITFYNNFKTPSALLLEDLRTVVNKVRMTLTSIDIEEEELSIEDKIKVVKDLTVASKGIPALIKELNEAEKSMSSEITEQGRIKGSAEKTIFDDDLNI